MLKITGWYRYSIDIPVPQRPRLITPLLIGGIRSLNGQSINERTNYQLGQLLNAIYYEP